MPAKPFDPMHADRERKRLRSWENQVARAVAGIELAINAVPLRDRVIILHAALKGALADLSHAQRRPET